jgi:hypothetical protein
MQVMKPFNIDKESVTILLCPLNKGIVESTPQAILFRDDPSSILIESVLQSQIPGLALTINPQCLPRSINLG